MAKQGGGPRGRGGPRRHAAGPKGRTGPQPRRSPSRAPRPEPREDGPERLQKLLAHAGVGSRRACEDLILQGRVTVNGQVVRELGTRVEPGAQIAVDGQKVGRERLVYYAVHKPRGYVSTNNDPAGRPRVIDLLPEVPQRVYTVGRLDEMSVGLIILTNDGELANRLTHPKFGVEKVYRVVVAGSPTREVLNKLTEGMWLAEGKVRAQRVRVTGRKGEATILEMVLSEGKNREVRRMLAQLGHKVMALTRIAVGPITLKGLSPGESRPLTAREVDLLRRVAAGESVPMAPSRDRERRPATGRGPSPRPTGERAGSARAGAEKPVPSGPRARSAPPPSAGRRAGRRPSGTSSPPAGAPARPGPGANQATGRPPRPAGPPPSQRRRPPREDQPRLVGPSAAEPPSRRRIIGMEPEPPAAGPIGAKGRRPPPRRRPAGQGPKPRFRIKKRRPTGEDDAGAETAS